MNLLIKVKSCQDCPFANNDNETGYNMCNLSEFLSNLVKPVKVPYFTELPEDRRHEDCPIDTEVVITVK